MILCTLAGPDPRAFNTSRRGAEVGKPLRDGESYLFEKRRAEVGATLSSKFTGLCHRYQLSRVLLDMTVAARYVLLAFSLPVGLWSRVLSFRAAEQGSPQRRPGRLGYERRSCLSSLEFLLGPGAEQLDI